MKKIILSVLLSYVILQTGLSQGIEVFDMSQGTYDRIVPTSPYLLTGKLQDNVFAGLAFGTNFYMGNDDGKGSEGSRAGLAWELSVGKWATPFIGVRLQYSSMKARGHTASQSIYHYGTPDASGYYQERFGIDNYRGDLLINLRNLVQGYSNERLWNCVPLVGVGIGHSHGRGHSRNEFNMNAGVLNIFRILDRVDGTFEMRYMAVNSRFDGVAGNGLDGSLSLTFGVQFNFGKKGFHRPIQLLQSSR